MKGDKYHYNQEALVQTNFATGMNGDEDLGQNIIMKGDKYHYNQENNLVQFATGMNGDEDLGQNIIMKGDKYHYNQDASLVQFATGMNGDEDLGQNIIMKGDKYHYNQAANLAQIPTCTDRHVDNCQPVCDEYQTTGCTESRTPTSYPMRTWDWRDRFEGRKTFDYTTANRPF